MNIPVIPAAQVARLGRAIPFWLSLGILPVVVLAAIQGGWVIA
jgi:alkane 1-monooxygenase